MENAHLIAEGVATTEEIARLAGAVFIHVQKDEDFEPVP